MDKIVSVVHGIRDFDPIRFRVKFTIFDFDLIIVTSLFITNVGLPKISWKAVEQPWVGSRETSVHKVAVCPPDDTSP